MKRRTPLRKVLDFKEAPGKCLGLCHDSRATNNCFFATTAY